MDKIKRILGLDLGTNSIGWALVKQDFDEKQGKIMGLGSRIIPMSQGILGDFDKGNSISQTAERTRYRGIRRLYQRDTLRRERLHRVLNILGFLPQHYRESIDFEHKKGQFKTEVKLNYKKNAQGKHEFLFMSSFNEMAQEFNEDGVTDKIPYDWTLYYLRKKALTQKISKEELAWVLLNFNQKRGYYQLRDEQEEDKSKSFEVLKVKEVIDSGDKVKDNVLYNVVFENDWRYDKQITKPEDWLDKEKEFIVTTKVNKDGSIKRSFKKVDSEKDWLAIKAKTEQDIQQSGKTVGQFIYETLRRTPVQKIRGKLVKTIERKFYKEEFEAILKKQIDLHEELKSPQLYKDCLEELYPHNQAHKENIKDKGFLYLFMDDIIFYQRPLKSKKSTIANCSYEFHTYADENNNKIERYLKGAPKSNPYYQEFRLWQFLKNLKIYQREKIVQEKTKVDEDVTDELLSTKEQWVDLFDFLNNKKEIEQKDVIKYFVKKKQIAKGDEKNYRWNYVEDKKYPCNETRADFISRLNNINNVNSAEFLTQGNEYALWHIVYSVKDKQEFEKALTTFARKHGLDIDSFVENFKKHKPYKNEYGSYSEKTLKKLLPLMRRGKYWQEDGIPEEVKNRIADIMERVESIEPDTLPKKGSSEREKELNQRLENIADDAIPARLIKSFIPFYKQNAMSGLNTYQACYAVYKRHSEASDITHWGMEDLEKYLKNFKQHSLRNPIVEQIVTETLRIVRDIWQHYGKDERNFFNEIHIELGREMKNDSETRKRITNQNTERENTNFRIKKLLEEMSEYKALSYSPSHQERLKLYEEGVFQNPKVDFSKVKEDEVLKIREKLNTYPKKSEEIKQYKIYLERYKLWLEQGYLSPYTGKTIALSELFSKNYQIEHIIPQSRYFDDSLNNKVICESAVNEAKSNKTAYEFIKDKGGERIDLGLGNGQSVELLKLEAYEAHCKEYFKKNKTKLKNLLSEDIPEGFINRQINDSRYISKLIKGLLSNIVREEGEREAISKHVTVMPGAITSRLKHDWGLEDKWNELVAPRFKRLNKMTSESEDHGDYGFFDSKINAFRCKVPDTIAKGFSKKRIDHRHHALDALVIACTTKDHINYITSLNTARKNHSLVSKLQLIEEKQIKDEKTGKIKTIKKPIYHKPWNTFTIEAKSALEKTIISFKQNQRIINRTNNYYQKWIKENGVYKKVQIKQKGGNFAIRKSLHKETFLGKVLINRKKKEITGYASRKALSTITRKQVAKITDSGIRKIINNHLKNYTDDKSAFSPEGIEQMNKNIKQLNDGKPHQPIYHVRLYEESKKKIYLGDTGNKKTKYVEAAQGTNLFFAIYQDEKKERVFETIPLNEVIEHQKQRAVLSKEERKAMPLIPIDHTKGKFLFSLSPNDLVYVPTDEEMENPDGIDFNSLDKDQVNRIYKMVSTTKDRAEFRQANIAELIETYTQKHKFGELGNQNKMKTTMCEEKYDIAARCLKLKIDRLGNIKKVIKP